jgi:hypothetical protein
MIHNRNRLFVSAIFAFFAINFCPSQSSLFAAEPANRRVIESGPAEQLICHRPTRPAASPNRRAS